MRCWAGGAHHRAHAERGEPAPLPKGRAHLTIAPVPTLFFGGLRRLVRENDLVVIVEGSTYMDTWGSALLWAFLWASRCAAKRGRPCLAYAVDAGEL